MFSIKLVVRFTCTSENCNIIMSIEILVKKYVLDTIIFSQILSCKTEICKMKKKQTNKHKQRNKSKLQKNERHKM